MIRKIALANGITFANDAPLVLIGGLNVLERREIAQDIAGEFVRLSSELAIPFVFKASFDKANRSSIDSFRGPGLVDGLSILADIKSRFGVPILTDVHEVGQAEAVAEVADILQVPAFLARQTDLVVAAARTGAVINVKKPQFLAPHEMRHIVRKCADAGNERILLCERGTMFGYNNLIVDMLGMEEMKTIAPVVFDVSHSLQRPGARVNSAGGRREQITALMRAGVATGIAGLFVEGHRDPDEALCDGPCALRLDRLRPFLEQALAIDRLIKSFPALDTA